MLSLSLSLSLSLFLTLTESFYLKFEPVTAAAVSFCFQNWIQTCDLWVVSPHFVAIQSTSVIVLISLKSC